MGFGATINLVNASLLVGISGAFRLYIAFLFFGAKPSVLASIGGSLVIYTVLPPLDSHLCELSNTYIEQFIGSNKLGS